MCQISRDAFHWPPLYDNLSYSITVRWISLNFNDPPYAALRVECPSIADSSYSSRFSSPTDFSYLLACFLRSVIRTLASSCGGISSSAGCWWAFIDGISSFLAFHFLRVLGFRYSPVTRFLLLSVKDLCSILVYLFLVCVITVPLLIVLFFSSFLSIFFFFLEYLVLNFVHFLDFFGFVNSIIERY